MNDLTVALSLTVFLSLYLLTRSDVKHLVDPTASSFVVPSLFFCTETSLWYFAR